MPPSSRSRATPPSSMVAIGGSAGGLAWFAKVLRRLPVDLGMSFVFVQHFEGAVEREGAPLRAPSVHMAVHEAHHGMKLDANAMYLMPAGCTVTYVDDAFSLRPGNNAESPSALLEDFMLSFVPSRDQVVLGLLIFDAADDEMTDVLAPPEMQAPITAQRAIAELQRELAVSRELLESANQERIAADDRAQMREAELKQLVHDHGALVEAADLAAILAGRDMRLRRMSPPAKRLLCLEDGDIGRPLSELHSIALGAALARNMTEAIEGACTRTMEFCDERAHHLAVVLSPYRTLDGHIDGGIMTVSDITQQRVTEEALANAELRLLALEAALHAALKKG